MAESDNVDDVGAWLQATVASFHFERPGKDQSLGRDLAGIVARGIADRSVQGLAPDGSEWAENAPRYRKWKRNRYQVDQPNVRTGQMLSLESLMGQVEVSAHEVVIGYGTNQPPTSGSTGVVLDADKRVTDRQKAEWSSKDRPFFGLDDEIRENLIREAGEALDEYLGGG